MKKICYICSNLSYKNSNGLYTLELIKRLNKQFEIHAIIGASDKQLNNTIIHKRINLYKSDKSRFLNGILNTIYIPIIKKKYKIDLFHSQFLSSINPDLVTMHGCYKAWCKIANKFESYPITEFIKDHITLFPEKIILKKARKIIVVSEGLKKDILENYNISKEKIIVIQNGVDLEKFKPDLKKRIKIREKYKILDDEILLFFAGAFERKGLKYVIKALPLVKGKVKLMVVGGNNPLPYKDIALKLGVLDKIIFTGFVPSIVEYYCAADIFVFPSFYEAFSLATLEAVASGLPLITTKINGTEELVKEGYNGFFVKRDPKDIAEKINILIKDENLRKQMSRNARKLVEKNYTWDICAKKTAEVYEELLRI